MSCRQPTAVTHLKLLGRVQPTFLMVFICNFDHQVTTWATSFSQHTFPYAHQVRGSLYDLMLLLLVRLFVCLFVCFCFLFFLVCLFVCLFVCFCFFNTRLFLLSAFRTWGGTVGRMRKDSFRLTTVLVSAHKSTCYVHNPYICGRDVIFTCLSQPCVRGLWLRPYLSCTHFSQTIDTPSLHIDRTVHILTSTGLSYSPLQSTIAGRWAGVCKRQGSALFEWVR